MAWLAGAAAVGVAAWLALVALLLLIFRGRWWPRWREPVWRHPVLVLDSDDWGAGPLAQAGALRELAALLARHHDAEARPAVLNLALVLAVPDGEAIRARGGYHRIELDAPRFAPVRDALLAGRAQRVFTLVLHGHEHCWPPALVASRDPTIAAWLHADPPQPSEALPSALQSRWVDAGSLPSRPLPDAEVDAAAAAECAAFERITGEAAEVVVPPTFVWTRSVERAWARHGVGVIVTPGHRSTCRGADGLPAGDEGPIVMGDRADGLTYLVRVDYFEPVRGRDARHALAVLDRCAGEGRPCVLENHRDNFIAGDATRERSLAELDALLCGARERHPGLRFLSAPELARVLRERDPAWLHLTLREALPARWLRLRASGRPWKLLVLTGAAALGAALVALLSSPSRSRAG